LTSYIAPANWGVLPPLSPCPLSPSLHKLWFCPLDILRHCGHAPPPRLLTAAGGGTLLSRVALVSCSPALPQPALRPGPALRGVELCPRPGPPKHWGLPNPNTYTHYTCNWARSAQQTRAQRDSAKGYKLMTPPVHLTIRIQRRRPSLLLVDSFAGCSSIRPDWRQIEFQSPCTRKPLH